jgi:adenylate kinase family enzyme
LAGPRFGLPADGPKGPTQYFIVLVLAAVPFAAYVQVMAKGGLMNTQRILIYGNAGSGKTTMAREAAAALGLARLCLDHLAWGPPGVRKPMAESLAALAAFIAENAAWVIEGCYGDLVEAALRHCTELRFLNPGVEACVANCRKRQWDPEYCESPEEQARYLEPLVAWVRQYDTRQDEYSLARHRAIFDAFAGTKREYGR